MHFRMWLAAPWSYRKLKTYSVSYMPYVSRCLPFTTCLPFTQVSAFHPAIPVYSVSVIGASTGRITDFKNTRQHLGQERHLPISLLAVVCLSPAQVHINVEVYPYWYVKKPILPQAAVDTAESYLSAGSCPFTQSLLIGRVFLAFFLLVGTCAQKRHGKTWKPSGRVI